MNTKQIRLAAITALLMAFAFYGVRAQVPPPVTLTPGPTITFDFGSTVSPGPGGLVMLSVHVNDATATFNNLTLSDSTAHLSSRFSPTHGPVQAGLYWSTRYAANGAQQTVTATVTDDAGITATKTATVTLVK